MIIRKNILQKLHNKSETFESFQCSISYIFSTNITFFQLHIQVFLFLKLFSSLNSQFLNPFTVAKYSAFRYLRSVLLVSLVLVSVTAEISDNQVDTENTDTGGSSLQKRTGGHHHGTGQTSNIIIICYGQYC